MTSSHQDIRGPRPGPVRRGGADGGVRIGGKLLRTVGRPADKWLRPADALSAISDTDEGDIFGAALYTPGETDGLPEEAVLASLGCGNPLAVAELSRFLTRRSISSHPAGSSRIHSS